MTVRIPKLRDWKPGDRYRESAHLQEPVAAIRQLAEAAGFGPAEGDLYPGYRFTAQTISHTQDGSNKRWLYKFEEMEKVNAGYGGWGVKADGLAGTAYNRVEDNNGASGSYGNGVSSTNLTGLLVEIAVVPLVGSDDVEFWFSYVNGIDGACS
jgi:hypothetical protein